MTDVLFLLLVFLAIAAKNPPTALPVDLPHSSTAPKTVAQVNVTVTAELRYYVEGQELPLEQLAHALKNQLEKKGSQLVLLHLDRSLSIAQMVAVADLANGLGAAVSIATTSP